MSMLYEDDLNDAVEDLKEELEATRKDLVDAEFDIRRAKETAALAFLSFEDARMDDCTRLFFVRVRYSELERICPV